jgi:hypothetical protein
MYGWPLLFLSLGDRLITVRVLASIRLEGLDLADFNHMHNDLSIILSTWPQDDIDQLLMYAQAFSWNALHGAATGRRGRDVGADTALPARRTSLRKQQHCWCTIVAPPFPSSGPWSI